MFRSKPVGAIVNFFAPYIQPRKFDPGRQPYNPGESQQDYIGNGHFRPIPWPNAVPVLHVLSSNPGIPRDRALQIDNNSYSYLPTNWLYIAGFVGKSRG